MSQLNDFVKKKTTKKLGIYVFILVFEDSNLKKQDQVATDIASFPS